MVDRLNKICEELGLKVEMAPLFGKKRTSVKIYTHSGKVMYFTSASYALRIFSLVKGVLERRVK